MVASATDYFCNFLRPKLAENVIVMYHIFTIVKTKVSSQVPILLLVENKLSSALVHVHTDDQHHAYHEGCQILDMIYVSSHVGGPLLFYESAG